MEHQLTYNPSYTFLSQVAWRKWRNTSLRAYCMWIVIPLVTLLLCLGAHAIPLSGTGGVLVCALSGVVLTLVILLVYSFFRARQSIHEGAIRRSKKELHCTFNEKGAYYRDDLNSYHYSWKSVTIAQVTPKAIRLLFDQSVLLSLPLEVAPREVQKFILTQVQEAGGQLT